jgi:hypothetical protein
MYAYKWSYQFHKGEEVPSGKVVMHKCDNKICVNPEHLELGTQLDNIADMVAKGRQRGGRKKNKRR